MAVLAALTLTVVAMWRVTPPEVTRHDLRADPLRLSFRVVQLSDLHLQRIGETERALIAQVRSLEPDLVVLSGDAIDRADGLPILKAFLEDLGALPVIAVPGNWEHWSGVDFQGLASLVADRSHGVLLLNDVKNLTAKGRTVRVVGLDDFTAGQPDGQLLAADPAYELNLLVQHSPGFFDVAEVGRRMSGQRFSLCLSGHTHGGQVVLGGWAPWRPVGSGRFIAGFFDVPGCRLYVSRGVGTSVLPVRWGAVPEIAVFDM
jgi:uncharacterized protein